MNHAALQTRLTALGAYAGPITGTFDAATRMATLKALTDGPDWKLEQRDAEAASERLGVVTAKIWTVWDVEASANPFIAGRPTILFEPHRFSRATQHRFDATHPRLSSRAWNKALYPASQNGRWQQLLDAVALDVDAGFASASYGGFQILGENFAICGASSPWSFAWQEAQTEADQLEHFCLFVEGTGLKRALQRGDWAAFAKGYNGTGYRLNRYDERLAAAFARRLAA